MRIVAFAASMQHQIEAGDYPKTIAREGPKPSHLFLVNRKL